MEKYIQSILLHVPQIRINIRSVNEYTLHERQVIYHVHQSFGNVKYFQR
jgi:hypothetical protein